MITVDYLIIAVIVVSMLVGFFRGFFPELVSIGTWILAIFAAWHFNGLVEPYLQGKLGSVVAELWASRLIIFVVTLILGGLVGQLISLIIDKTGLSGTDRMLGLVFGFARGAVIFGVLVIVGQLLGFTKEPWWPESRMIPIGERIAETLRVMVPENVSEFIEQPSDADAAPAPTVP
ncbi:MAG: CvpA family protein [Gammaproteobacteria bacterium]|nr:CvpA family protein [Gammaproteobacteria bacterium]